MYGIEENQRFGNANVIDYTNFNATTLKVSKKFDLSFPHIFIFGNIFAQGHGFDAVTAISNMFRLPSLIIARD